MAKDKKTEETPQVIDPATTPREYRKLDKTVDYDHDAAEEVATALNELKMIEDRATYLREIINENKALHPFVWTTSLGVATAIHDLEDEHFRNILTHIVERGDKISTALRSEARRRKIVAPEAPSDRYRLARGTTNASRSARIKELYGPDASW